MSEEKKPAPAAKPQASDKPVAKDSAKAGAASQADPAKTHVEATWKYNRPLTSCRVDPTGRFAFVGTEDYTVVRFQLSDGAQTKLEGHESWCRAFAFLPDGKTTLSGGYDGRLLWWQTDAKEPKPLRTVQAHDGWIRAVAVSPDGRTIATCGNDNLVKLWDAADGKPLRTLAGHERHVYNVAFHPDGKSLVSCDLKMNFKHWNLSTGKEERSFRAEAMTKYDDAFRADIGGARSLVFSDDGKLLCAGGTTNCTNAFGGILECAAAEMDWETGKLKVLHLTKEKNRGTVWGLRWHKDGYWVGMSGGRNALLVFWKPGAAEEFAKFAMPEIGRDGDLYPDGLHFATAMSDGQLRVCRLAAKA